MLCNKYTKEFNMKKYMIFALMIAIVPNYVFGESARYRQLVAEKQRKMAELEQCSGDVNGWKIAGISTLGLTAVGVAGNIALANKQSNLDDKIAKADKQIDKYNSQIETRQGEIMAENVRRSDCQNTGGKYTSAGCQCPDGMDLIGTICKVKNPEPVITQPNTPNQQGDGPKNSPEPNSSNGEGKDCRVGNYTLPHSDNVSLNSVTCSSLAGGFNVTNANVCLCTCQNGVANCVVDSCLNGYAPSADKKKCECNTESGYEVNNEGKCVKKSDDKGANGNKTQETDCTTEAKKLDSNVVKAVKKGDKCEVTKCESGFEPNDTKTGCKSTKSTEANDKGWHKPCSSEDFKNSKFTKNASEGWYDYKGDCVAKACNTGWKLATNSKGNSQGYCVEDGSKSQNGGGQAEQKQKTDEGDFCVDKSFLSQPGLKYKIGTYKNMECAVGTASREPSGKKCDCECMKGGKWKCTYTEEQRTKDAQRDPKKVDIDVQGKSETHNNGVKGSFSVIFDYGTVTGESMCSISDNTQNYPKVDTGEECWCRIISIPDKQGSGTWKWAHRNPGYCKNRCAGWCADFIKNYKTERKKMFF